MGSRSSAYLKLGLDARPSSGLIEPGATATKLLLQIFLQLCQTLLNLRK
jgi:hypothetical protein